MSSYRDPQSMKKVGVRQYEDSDSKPDVGSQHAGAGSGERPPKGITTLGGSGGMLHWEFFVP